MARVPTRVFRSVPTPKVSKVRHTLKETCKFEKVQWNMVLPIAISIAITLDNDLMCTYSQGARRKGLFKGKVKKLTSIDSVNF